jgi:hypothetical protein
MFSGMDREQWHVRSFRRSFPTGNRLLVVIDNFNIRRTGGTFWPFEANTPLVVDADAVLAFPAALQGLEPVSGQNGKVAERQGRFEPVQLQAGGAFDAREGFDTFSGREGGSFLAPETNDHECSLVKNTPYVKRNVLMVVGPEESGVFPARSWVFDPGLLLGDQALHELGPFLLVGLDAFVQQHFTDLDSVGRRCATRVAQTWGSAVPLKTNAD